MSELPEIHSMLCDFSVSQKNHWHVHVILLAQFGVRIDVDFPQVNAEFGEQRCDLQFGFIA